MRWERWVTVRRLTKRDEEVSGGAGRGWAQGRRQLWPLLGAPRLISSSTVMRSY